jgi:hypothetical protein
VRALSWTQVDGILDELAALNVYDRAIITGSSFKLEAENFDDNGDRRQLWFFGTREKSYAFSARDDHGAPIIAKHSAHTIANTVRPALATGSGDGSPRPGTTRFAESLVYLSKACRGSISPRSRR